jgi:hypothetical protein
MLVGVAYRREPLMAMPTLIMEVALAHIHTTEAGPIRTGGQWISKHVTPLRKWRWSTEEIVVVS